VATLKLIALAAAAGYAAIVLLMWVAQERLLFYPPPRFAHPAAPAGWTLEEVDFESADRTRLAGVLVRPHAQRGPLVIYFGGNAEESTAYAAQARDTYGDRAALFVNYRGYGGSGGAPGEKAMVADAIALYDWAARRPDVDAERIAVHGRSLGTGVAVQVAAARAPRCVILTSPFESARDVARAMYPWLPVGLLLRHPFDSLALAPNLRMPALILIGEADNLIAPSHSERLAAGWGGPVEQARFPGFGHNDLNVSPRYAQAIQDFLSRCLR
jgi:fermentation-respiration switch protein FrsA (DUF1100 family)